MVREILTLLAAVAAALPIAAMAQPDKPVSIVLVHGAFVDGSGWQSTYELLARQGYEVLVVQNPTISLAGDVDATNRAIARAKHPVVLVGHSYGGAVITEAGNNPKVRSLIYIAAFAPDAGESVLSLAEEKIPNEPGAPLLPPNDGYLFVDQAKFPEAFAKGVDPALTTFMAAAQVPWGLEAVGTKIATPAWKAKPTNFIVTTEDHMVPPTLQRRMAKRAGGRTLEIASSHAVMLRYPQKVADFIASIAETAAR
jgi:pimeloyl-ACP methyl ester carboxylesterase